MVLGSIASFVAAVAGIYRLGRLAFGPLVGAIAALLLLSRFFVENLAAQGYLDISYLALILWALGARARAAPARHARVRAAGGGRPAAPRRVGAERAPTGCGAAGRDCAPGPHRWPSVRRMAAYLALAASAPVLWVAFDAIVTGNPLYSLTATGGLAQELERTQGFTAVLGSVWSYSVRIDQLPGRARRDRRACCWRSCWRRGGRWCRWPRWCCCMRVYVLEGAGGASVIDRYLTGAATVALLFCAVAVGGWWMLEPGTMLRRGWIAFAVVLVIYGAVVGGQHDQPLEPAHDAGRARGLPQGLAVALHNPRWPRALRRCPLLSLPNNKLIPDARWILDSVGQRDIVARSQARGDAARAPPSSRSGSSGAAWRSTRSAARCSRRPSSTSATIPWTRSRRRTSVASTRAATTPSMQTAERRCRADAGLPPGPAPRRHALGLGARLALAALLAGGSRCGCGASAQGCPFVYNIDEADHFVPAGGADVQRGHSLNPHYFANPPAFTYLLHFLLRDRLRRAAAASSARFQHDPTGGLGAGARRRGGARHARRCGCCTSSAPACSGAAAGLLAAAIEAVAFLPAFYAHLALNDVPTLAPLTLSLLGTAGVLRNGRGPRLPARRASASGWPCATKYTGGIVLVPLLAAARPRACGGPSRAPAAGARGARARRRARALALFVIANPYSVLDFHAFHAELAHQSSAAAEAHGKLGATHGGGILYYLWTFTWGLGWVPALAALGGRWCWSGAARRRSAGCWSRRRCCSSLFMGLQGRYFGRWLMPIFPIVCLLAAPRARSLVRGALGASAPARRAAARGACRRSWPRAAAPRASSTASTPGASSRAPTRAT